MGAWQWKICCAIGGNPYCCSEVWNHFAGFFLHCASRVDNCPLLPWQEGWSLWRLNSPYLLLGNVNIGESICYSSHCICRNSCSCQEWMPWVWNWCIALNTPGGIHAFLMLFFLWPQKFKTLGSFERHCPIWEGWNTSDHGKTLIHKDVKPQNNMRKQSNYTAQGKKPALGNIIFFKTV